MNNKFIDNKEDGQKEERLPLKEILEAVKNIRYGYVQLTIQDSKIVQIEKTEKLRLDKGSFAK